LLRSSPVNNTKIQADPSNEPKSDQISAEKQEQCSRSDSNPFTWIRLRFTVKYGNWHSLAP